MLSPVAKSHTGQTRIRETRAITLELCRIPNGSFLWNLNLVAQKSNRNSRLRSCAAAGALHRLRLAVTAKCKSHRPISTPCELPMLPNLPRQICQSTAHRSISIAPLRAGGLALKLPGHIEVAVRDKMLKSSIARYECAGGWEVMYQRIPQDSGHFGPELKY